MRKLSGINTIKNKVIYFFKKSSFTLIPFTTSLVIFMIYCIIKNNTTFYYDSSYYWSLSSNFYVNNQFSLTKFFPQSIRGYFLPFLLFVAKSLGNLIFKNEFIGLWLLNSTSFSIILTILFEIFIKKHCISMKKNIISSIIFSLLIIAFYRWMLIYPLSDNIALMLFLLAIFCSIKQFNNNIINNIKYIFIGYLLYACYNTRPAYLISIIIFVCIWAVFNIKNKLRCIKNIIFILLGFFIAAFPQSIINNIHLQTYSPLVTFSYGGSKNLNLAQLYYGLYMNSYQTTIAPLHNYPVPGVASINKTGQIIIGMENITADNISYLAIIRLIFKYPFEMIGIYFSHLTRLLFVLDSDGYIKNMNKNLSLIFFINSIIIYLTGMFILTLKHEENGLLRRLKNIDKKYLYFLCPAISAILIIPGAVESRFFIYVHVIIYFILSFVVEYKSLFEIFKKHYIKIILSFLCFIGVFSSILSYNLASQYPEGTTFSLNPYDTNIKKEINNQIENNLTPYIPKSVTYENKYCPPDFSFITKTSKEGKILFSITFDKDITKSNNMYIYINGKLENVTREIKKGTYNFEFTAEPNKINSVQIESSFYYNDEQNRRVSFKFDNFRIR